MRSAVVILILAVALSSSALIWSHTGSAQAAVAAATSAPATSAPAKTITLTGLFTTQFAKGNQNLKAVLTPSGDKTYDVVYTFKWGGADKIWKGPMKGDLNNGDVTGGGDGEGRTFIFKATAVNGIITGKTFETTGGKTVGTGAISMKQ